MKEGCMNIQLLRPSFGDVRVFTDLPYVNRLTEITQRLNAMLQNCSGLTSSAVELEYLFCF